ncbi:MAG: hypothetical protein ACERKN_19185 [Velocimicrobium sp.]
MLDKIKKYLDNNLWAKKSLKISLLLSFITILLYFTIKYFSYVLIIIVGTGSIIYVMHKKEIEQKQLQQIRYQELMRQKNDIYITLGHFLSKIINEYSTSLGIRNITSSESVFATNSKRFLMKDNFNFFAYRAQVHREPEFPLRELKQMLQERIEQSYEAQGLEFIMPPIWLAKIIQESQHLYFIVTFQDCQQVADYREYIKNKDVEEKNLDIDKKDEDF